MKTPFLFFTIAATAFAADAPAPKADDIAKTYSKTLTRLTEKPKSIGAEFSTACGRVPIDKTAGPHSRNYVHYFRDAVAQQPGEKFAPGSVLVKEKLRPALRGEDPKIDAVAGMIKRPSGTHPKSGDWEFFWFADGKLTTTGLESCAGCHSGAKRDYVFVDFPNRK
jgi:hypothetical protein